MRCYFLNNGQVAGVETMPPGLSDKDAIGRAHVLSLKRRGPFDGFEIWHHNRCVFKFSTEPRNASDPSAAGESAASGPMIFL
jgi:hypothetical protein